MEYNKLALKKLLKRHGYEYTVVDGNAMIFAMQIVIAERLDKLTKSSSEIFIDELSEEGNVPLRKIKK